MTAVDRPAACPYPFSEAEKLALDPEYGRLRDNGELARVSMPYGGDAWLATSYEDVKTVLADPRFSRAATFNRDVPRTAPLIQSDPNLLSMDPPDHTRLRKLVAKAFTARRMEGLRPRAQEVVDELLDRMIEQGPPADLVEGLALPLPITMICELLGVPYEDRDRFRAWSDAVLSLTAHTVDQIAEARDELKAYLAGLVEQRREKPTDDLLGVLVLARDEEERLSEAELVQFGVTLLVAGHETTANQIGNFVYTLLSDRERWAELRADPELLNPAIEELMRFTPLGSNAGFPRIALEDVELSGTLVRAGEAVLTQNAAANRDKSVWDKPEELDFHREHNPHIAFGHGAHHCLGAQLARVELQVAVGSLLKRMPDLRFAVPAEQVPFKHGRLVRGLRSMPVAW
ncbi:cytochrome P450 [Kutzneria viridogrisea]|uniref:Cytochrome P450-SU1 n=2 Tax=Kutzneria TaxID=43356 RepID=W5W2G8_9PSEU|nr:cytochrome P450 [Kutzneria albida]AHH94990.1 Cytochrome P450-SU1 [Kutzneria albida DSM 43870]MBA8927654.1 cytochrome P450 RapN [Kutzneria viridogrisea]